MLYMIALFLHIIGALLLAAATGIEWQCIVNMRKGGTIGNVRQAAHNYSKLAATGGIGMFLILIPGIYMMAVEWQHYSGWIAVGFFGLVIMGAIGGAVTGRKMRKIEKTLKSEKALNPTIENAVADGAFLFSLRLRTVVFAGVILIMVAKPPVPTSVIILVVSLVVGALPLGGRSRTAAVAQPE